MYILLCAWEGCRKQYNSPSSLSQHLKYHLQLKTKEDVGGGGAFMGGDKGKAVMWI